IVDFDDALAAHRRGGTSHDALAAARAQFAHSGMRYWLQRAEALRAKRSDAYPAGLTAREAEVLRLLARGHSNKQIAAELVLSIHTVERHVANAYAKIGARNRASATAF